MAFYGGTQGSNNRSTSNGYTGYGQQSSGVTGTESVSGVNNSYGTGIGSLRGSKASNVSHMSPPPGRSLTGHQQPATVPPVSSQPGRSLTGHQQPAIVPGVSPQLVHNSAGQQPPTVPPVSPRSDYDSIEQQQFEQSQIKQEQTEHSQPEEDKIESSQPEQKKTEQIISEEVLLESKKLEPESSDTGNFFAQIIEKLSELAVVTNHLKSISDSVDSLASKAGSFADKESLNNEIEGKLSSVKYEIIEALKSCGAQFCENSESSGGVTSFKEILKICFNFLEKREEEYKSRIERDLSNLESRIGCLPDLPEDALAEYSEFNIVQWLLNLGDVLNNLEGSLDKGLQSVRDEQISIKSNLETEINTEVEKLQAELGQRKIYIDRLIGEADLLRDTSLIQYLLSLQKQCTHASNNIQSVVEDINELKERLGYSELLEKTGQRTVFDLLSFLYYEYLQEKKENGDLQTEVNSLREQLGGLKKEVEEMKLVIEGQKKYLDREICGVREEVGTKLKSTLDSVNDKLDNKCTSLQDDWKRAESGLIDKLDDKICDIVKKIMQDNPALYNAETEKLLKILSSYTQDKGKNSVTCTAEDLRKFGLDFASLTRFLENRGITALDDTLEEQEVVNNYFGNLMSEFKSIDSLSELLKGRLLYCLSSSVPGDIRKNIMHVFSYIFLRSSGNPELNDVVRVLLGEQFLPTLNRLGCEIIHPERGDVFDEKTMSVRYAGNDKRNLVSSCFRYGVVWRLADGSIEVGCKAEVEIS